VKETNLNGGPLQTSHYIKEEELTTETMCFKYTCTLMTDNIKNKEMLFIIQHHQSPIELNHKEFSVGFTELLMLYQQQNYTTQATV
jgi:hypothetical protein